MASSTEPTNGADLGDNIRRLNRRIGEAHPAQADAGFAEPQLREAPREIPKDAPKARGRVRPRVARRASQIASMARRRASSPRSLLFALLPIVLAIGAYFYVTGGSTMSTENAYVQADMVNVSTDVSGIVSTVDVKVTHTVTGTSSSLAS